ncbi:hypothetical protein C0992_005865 [Termitomyces sp. T32_za158]|nr:hypothetical protein C0992_005865 [Termitomyces sp. T32_za158]
MQFSAVLLALAAASSAYAVDHLVTVGNNGSLAFFPSSLNVSAGDNVIFEFRAKNHSVTQSSFAIPCSPLPDGSNSGFQAVTTTTPPFPRWNITISNTSTPFWFYCAQTNPIVHCNSGMVFAINPTADKSFNAFQAAANASASTGLPGSGASGAVSSGAQSSSTPTTANSSDGSDPSGTSTGGPAPTNGAARMASSTSGILALAGLLVGLMF